MSDDFPTMDQLHPRADDSLESERCPDCGRPGLPTGMTWAMGLLQEWACPDCEPEYFAEEDHDG